MGCAFNSIKYPSIHFPNNLYDNFEGCWSLSRQQVGVGGVHPGEFWRDVAGNRNINDFVCKTIQINQNKQTNEWIFLDFHVQSKKKTFNTAIYTSVKNNWSREFLSDPALVWHVHTNAPIIFLFHALQFLPGTSHYTHVMQHHYVQNM